MRIAMLYKHKNITLFIISIITILILALISQFLLDTSDGNKELLFNGERAYQDVIYQTSLGSRVIGSDAHAKVVQWLQDRLNSQEWGVEVQEGNKTNVPIKNIIAKRGTGTPWIILGAHYDSRIIADRDQVPEKRLLPVPGANDGASGVAVLLEIARVLPQETRGQIWLVFFDAEDNGNYQGQDWILGSRLFVENLKEKPDAMILVDMIGDTNLTVYWERNSDQRLNKQIWDIANRLGYSDIFIPVYKHKIIDDHIPFLEANIPAIDIIDFDYPYWHTTADTADKVSSESLSVIGNTILKWLETYKP